MMSNEKSLIAEVAEKVYYHVNPDTKMCVPNGAYIMTEKWHDEWFMVADTDLGFFDWIIANKQPKR